MTTTALRRTGDFDATTLSAVRSLLDEDRRRQGVATAVTDDLEAVIRAEDDLGALSASEDGAGLHADRGSMPLDPRGGLTCDWREGDVW